MKKEITIGNIITLLLLIMTFIWVVSAIEINDKIFKRTSIWNWHYYTKYLPETHSIKKNH